jgi:hypothetical protein
MIVGFVLTKLQITYRILILGRKIGGLKGFVEV